MSNEIPKPSVPAPDIVRCAYMELVVTDLARSREFYVDLLGFRKISALAGRHLFLRAGGSVFLLFRAAETLRAKDLPAPRLAE